MVEKPEKPALDALCFAYPTSSGPDLLRNVSALIFRDYRGFGDTTAVLLKTNGEELAICEAKKLLGFLPTSPSIGGVWYMKCDDKDKPLMQLQREDRGWFSGALSVAVQSPPGNTIGRVEIMTKWFNKQVNTCQDANGAVIATFNREYRWFQAARTSFHSVDGLLLGSLMHSFKETVIEFSPDCSPHTKIMMTAAAIMYMQMDRWAMKR